MLKIKEIQKEKFEEIFIKVGDNIENKQGEYRMRLKFEGPSLVYWNLYRMIWNRMAEAPLIKKESKSRDEALLEAGIEIGKTGLSLNLEIKHLGRQDERVEPEKDRRMSPWV